MSVPESLSPDRSQLRASDADRDRVADELREALAEGRVTPEEHAERIDAVYAAKTYADLEPIVADLPVPESGRPLPATAVRTAPAGIADDLPAPTEMPGNIVAVFGGATRGGRWLVPVSTTVTAAFGGVEIDLRQAVLAHREVTISVTAIFGGVELKVPPGVRVVNSMTGVFGGASVPRDDTDDVDAPVVRLTGFALFGGVEAQRRPGAVGRRWAEIKERRHEIRTLRRERREERRLRRGES
jgi:hypothetical protein